MTTNNPILRKQENAKYYSENKEYHRARNANRKRVVQEFVKQYKESHPCADCNNLYPACVMDFDHLPQFEKTEGIAIMAKHTTLPRVMEEIAKCELVCSNCHRIRTWLLRDLPKGMGRRVTEMAGRSGAVAP